MANDPPNRLRPRATATSPPTGRRREVLALLRRATTPMTITEIAGQVGGHVNTIRFHLDALTGSGQVEKVPAAVTGPGRPPLAFRARRGMEPDGPRNYRLLAEVLVHTVAATADPARTAIEAGRAWGSRLHEPAPPATRLTDDEAVRRLAELLDRQGFAAELRSVSGRRQIGLRHCPFLDLVQDGARVVCPLHLGLMQGAIGALDTSVTVEQLDPFAEPDLCLVHLGSTSSSALTTAPPLHR